jgi:hypothetical protein
MEWIENDDTLASTRLYYDTISRIPGLRLGTHLAVLNRSRCSNMCNRKTRMIWIASGRISRRLFF